jgi:hypothetical protein
MGTQNINLERYLNLWKIFEEKLEKEGLNLSSFCKKWGEQNSDKKSDYEIMHDKLKKMKNRKDKLKNVQKNTILSLEEYINFLDNDFTAENIRPDELPEHWFD